MRNTLFIENDQDNLYLNVSMNHPGGGYSPGFNATNEQPVLATYDITKDTPILTQPGDYYMSVIKFDIPLSLVPLLICKIIPNQPNPDLCQMSVGINNLGTNYATNLRYIAENTLSPPVQESLRQVITPYYYIYSYQTLLRMFNFALNDVWVSSGLAVNNPTYRAPFVYLNEATGLLDIVVPPAFIGTNGAVPRIFMNQSSANYLSAFDVKFLGYNQPFGRDYDFVLNGGLPAIPDTFFPISGVEYYRYSQDFSTLENWAILRKLIITSTGLPTKNEFIPSRNENDSQNASMQIIADFTPIINAVGDNNAICYYVPTSQWKLTDMSPGSPIQRVDLQVYWEDANNNIYPLYIPLYQQINIKIAFLNKRLYLGK